jgi:hypothetical protein
MQTLKTNLAIIGTLGILAVIGTLMNSPHAIVQGAGGGPTVTIDPTQLPLHVTGSTTIAGTVAATQSGAWNVGITGNTEATPFWVAASDNPARHPFVLDLVFTLPGRQAQVSVGKVPLGQRYVIEHYFVACTLETTGVLTDVSVSIGGGHVMDSAVPHFVQTLGTPDGMNYRRWSGSGNVRLYADPDATIFIGATANRDLGYILGCETSVTGYSLSLAPAALP